MKQASLVTVIGVPCLYSNAKNNLHKSTLFIYSTNLFKATLSGLNRCNSSFKDCLQTQKIEIEYIPDDSTESSLQEILFPPEGLQGGKNPSSNWSRASSKLFPSSIPSSLLAIPSGSRLDFRVEGGPETRLFLPVSGVNSFPGRNADLLVSGTMQALERLSTLAALIKNEKFNLDYKVRS